MNRPTKSNSGAGVSIDVLKKEALSRGGKTKGISTMAASDVTYEINRKQTTARAKRLPWLRGRPPMLAMSEKTM